MESRFSPSINIKRDTTSNYLYIPTKNSIEAYDTIAKNFKSGVHSYNIIGSYGTGKSAFLLAFYKHLNRIENYFTPVNGQFNGCSQFKFVQVVGNYESLVTSLSRELNVEAEEHIVYEKIKDLQNQLKSKKQCLILIIDEFGKSLEYAAKNNPERELYFIQRLAEYANHSGRNFLFLTTLHQNFDAYALGLNEKDRKEWEKVKGRIKELPFNEPVEQMLNLAGQALDGKLKLKDKKSLTKTFLKLIKKANLFRLRNQLDAEAVSALYPLEPLSASCLLIALQKYGQNERSLFSFLSSQEHFGLAEHIKKSKDKFYSLGKVYDYLLFNYSYLLQSKSNPDFFKWRVVITALDRVDALVEDNIALSKDIIKTIGLLDLINQGSSRINLEFLKQYYKEVVDEKNIDEALESIQAKGIIKYHKFKDSFSIYEGTDIDVELEIEKKKKEVGKIVSFEEELKKHIQLDYAVAKAVSYKKGTPRIYKYEITNEPIENFDLKKSEIDGYINIVLVRSRQTLDIMAKKSGEPIVYCVLKRSEDISNKLSEINVVDKILLENPLDKVARLELIEYKENLIKEFLTQFKQGLFSDKSEWYVGGKEISFKNEKELNIILSELSKKIYSATPTYRNELINKSKLSGTIQYAKKSFTNELILNWNKAYLGFKGSKFPPERTIYHTLLEDTGIHVSNLDDTAEFQVPTNSSFKKLWDRCVQFINDSKKGKRTVHELITVLQQKPFKLKDGFIEFWLISFLFIQRDDYALYYDGAYVANFTPAMADLLFKKAKSFSIKGIEVDGVRLSLFNKYRNLIQKGSSEKIKNKGFQEIAKPFLVFYKQLSTYSKHTKRNLSEETIRFREILLNAKELEKTFFEDLPICFGYDLNALEKDKKLLDAFAEKVQSSIRELRIQDDKLSERVFNYLYTYYSVDAQDFETLRNYLKDRYTSELDHLLGIKQKSLVRRIHSEIPDPKLWISSIVQAALGKPLDKINDDEELVLYDQLKKQLKNLDALLEISQLDFNNDKEIALRYDIQGSDKISKNNQIILNKKEQKQIKKLKQQVAKILDGTDEKVAEGLLIQLLKEL
ncbi:MAG: hypothetical protein HKN86_04455 [Acidimicrobiia bacterium]|nr:hypothetical protein [Acidimicrobiia bacterium]